MEMGRGVVDHIKRATLFWAIISVLLVEY